MDFTSLINTAGQIGIFIAALGYLISQFVRGRHEGSAEVVALLQTQISALKQTADGQADEIKQLTRDNVTFKTQLIEKDKKITELMGIITNRDPQFSEFVRQTAETLVEIKNYIKNK